MGKRVVSQEQNGNYWKQLRSIWLIPFGSVFPMSVWFLIFFNLPLALKGGWVLFCFGGGSFGSSLNKVHVFYGGLQHSPPQRAAIAGPCNPEPPPTIQTLPLGYITVPLRFITLVHRSTFPSGCEEHPRVSPRPTVTKTCTSLSPTWQVRPAVLPVTMDYCRPPLLLLITTPKH